MILKRKMAKKAAITAHDDETTHDLGKQKKTATIEVPPSMGGRKSSPKATSKLRHGVQQQKKYQAWNPAF
jgi:hypothetical protein